MATRYIYLSDELNWRLKKETNASELISKLLNDYYKTNTNDKEELLLMGKRLKDELKKVNEEKERDLKKVELKVKEIEKQEYTEEQRKEREEVLRNEREMYIQGVAVDEIGRRLTKEEVDLYFYELTNTKTNIYKFLEGLKNDQT